ncbi:MAG: hypothetical protein E6H67_03705 [Betaproteobacteria bacterium]|nr:MAG: hypothetical protein E6H74_08530 [Betaproteobacteria bacterium]TMH07460.1 MAG: hypothetical protein E6H67_03705 [Betaproteobacteria bacterium]
MNQSIGQHLRSRFDAFKLSASNHSIAGEVDAARLSRLADRIPEGTSNAMIAWQLDGGCDAQGRPALTLTLEGALPQICQRCLRPFAVEVSHRTELLLARNEAELARLDIEDTEVVLADVPLDAHALVEDELLLSLPFAPRHEDGTCVPAVPAAEKRDAVSPLAGLAAALRKKAGE